MLDIMPGNFSVFANVWEKLATMWKGKQDMMYICIAQKM
jgi:hypothetical protein